MGKIELTSNFEDITVGIKARLIAISMKKGKVYSDKSDLTIKSNETVQLSLKETTQDKVGELFQLN